MKDLFSNYRLEWEATYKKLKNDEVLWSEHPEIEDFIAYLLSNKFYRILDAGCGDGKNLSALIKFKNIFSVGCDSSDSALKLCERELRKRNKNLNEDEINNRHILIKSSIENMPFFINNYFDAAICIDVINHNKLPYLLLEELKRVVKKNGLIYISLFNIEDEIISSDEHKVEMTSIENGIPDREFIYSHKNADGIFMNYYFRFLTEKEIEDFIKPTGLIIIDKKVKNWKNPPHPHFRPYEHTHCNHMVLLKNV